MYTRIAAMIAALMLAMGLYAPAVASADTRVAYWTTEQSVTPGYTPTNLGSCSGTYKKVTKTQYARNMYGVALYHIKLVTSFYYSGGKVRCAWSSRTATVDFYGGIGGWSFKGWDSKVEAWYNWNGVYHGGIKTEVEGRFRLCYNLTAKTLCPQELTVTARTYVHGNGSYTTSGYAQ